MQTPLLLDYVAEHGSSKIRSFYIDENLYISLEDVVLTLARGNSSLNDSQKVGLGTLVKSQQQVLDKDECRQFPTGPERNARTETFITEPGLYRIISSDSTPASKKFQRWMFHEVLPSIRKHGTYPPPLQNNSDIMSLAQALAQNTSLLVREIAERERLETETRLRFEKTNLRIDRTEQKIDAIDQKIESISFENEDFPCLTVQDYCQEQNLEIDLTHLRGMCKKISLEKQVPVKKNPRSLIPMDDLYPCFLIDEAVKLITT